MANTTTTSKKMTKRDYFNILRESYPKTAENYDEVIKFIDRELELLAKKNSADKKPTAQQTANKEIQEAILNGMEANRLYSITEIIKEIPECAELTNQRVSALVRQMIPDHIERIEEKRKALFRKVSE